MKLFILAVACLVSTATFAQAEPCQIGHLNILNRAEGADSENIRELLIQETPNFSCEVTPNYYAFPADCGRFTYVEYEFKVTVGASVIEAVVQDGMISCRKMKKTVLAKSVISK